MTPKEVTEVFDEIGGADRSLHGWTYGPLRVYSGGGIAGNSDQYWIDFPGSELEKMGPYVTKYALKKSLHALFVSCIKLTMGIAEMENLPQVRA